MNRISRDRIFEFPEEPRRGKKTVIKRLRLTERVSHPTYVAATLLGAHPSDHQLSGDDNNANTLIENARHNWCTSSGGSLTGPTSARCVISLDWAAMAQPLAAAECTARGYPRLRADLVDPGPPNGNLDIVEPGPPNGRLAQGYGHWEYSGDYVSGNIWQVRVTQFRLYNAVCEKKVRVRRR